MSQKVSIGKLSIDQQLHDMVRDEVLPDTGIENTDFWESLDQLITTFGPRNQAALDKRDELQEQLVSRPLDTSDEHNSRHNIDSLIWIHCLDLEIPLNHIE